VLLYRNVECYTELDYPVFRFIGQDQEPIRYLQNRYKFQLRWYAPLKEVEDAAEHYRDIRMDQDDEDNEENNEENSIANDVDDNNDNKNNDDYGQNPQERQDITDSADNGNINNNNNNDGDDDNDADDDDEGDDQKQQEKQDIADSGDNDNEQQQRIRLDSIDSITTAMLFADSDESEDGGEQATDGQAADGGEQATDNEMVQENVEKVMDKSELRKHVFKAHRLQKDLLKKDDVWNPEAFNLQQRARWRVLDEHNLDTNDMAKMIRETSRYERAYMPATQKKIGGRLYPGLKDSQLEHATMAIRQRNIYSDPSYLWVPRNSDITDGMALWKQPTAESHLSRVSIGRDIVPLDVENAVLNCVGNCISCFSCFCSVCAHDPLTASQWILHPVGSLLDRIRLSHVQLPNNPRQIARVRSNVDSLYGTLEVDAGDRVWQLTRCAKRTYVARTSAICTIFEAAMSKYSVTEGNDQQCAGASIHLVVLHRLDFRKGTPACLPRWCVGHPEYERPWTDPKLAILCKSEASGCQNIVKQVNAGIDHAKASHSFIDNLQTIGQIDFSKQHPMVLWSAARSFVRPTAGKGIFHECYALGHGFSLYSVDLRTNKATFQWSPSALHHVAEGVYSISAVRTIWSSDHSVLVSSMNARKTWEIDSRMPCSVVNTWSLPHGCDKGMEDGKVPYWGNGGVGFLLSSQRSSVSGSDTLMGLNCSPGSFGIHFYRRPLNPPRLQTESVEIADVGTAGGSKGMSIASSSSYALPDVSGNVFSCGVDSFRVPMHLLGEEVSSRFPSVKTCLCVATATNKGDVYLHNLLESSAEQLENEVGHPSPALPIGVKAIAVPKVSTNPHSDEDLSETKSRKGKKPTLLKNSVMLKLSNEFPVPSSAVMLADSKHRHILKRKLPNGKVPVVAKRTTTAIEISKRQVIAGHSRNQLEDGVEMKRSAGAVPLALMKRDCPPDDNEEEEEQHVAVSSGLVSSLKDNLMATLDGCFEKTRSTSFGQRSDIDTKLFSQIDDTWDNDGE